MKPREFTSFEDECPAEHRHLIVTNNIEAKNAHGEMSHVWFVTFWIESEDKKAGIVTFDAGDRRVINLTHWKYA